MKSLLFVFTLLSILTRTVIAAPLNELFPTGINDPDEGDVKFMGLPGTDEIWKTGQTVRFSFKIEDEKYLEWYDPEHLKVYLERDRSLFPDALFEMKNVVIKKGDNRRWFTVSATIPKVDQIDNDFRIVLIRMFKIGWKTVAESPEFVVSPFVSEPISPLPIEKPAEEETPETETPVEEESPEQEVPEEEETPEQEVPEEEETPEQEVPVEEETPEHEVPAEEETPEQEVPKEEETPVETKPYPAAHTNGKK